MKKMVRLLSVVMLVAMCFSLMAASAYAAPVVVMPGSGSSGSGSSSQSGAVFSFGTDAATQIALENGQSPDGSHGTIYENDGRITGDGRDASVYVADVATEVSDTVSELVAKYASDVNINNESNPYYFMWLMNKFVNGEIDYSNPNDNELETARILFADFIDEMAVELAPVAAYQQVVESDQEVKEAVEAVNDASVEATDKQVEVAVEAQAEVAAVAEAIVEDINNAEDAVAFSPAASKYGKKMISVRSLVHDGNKAEFKKTAFDLHNVITKNGSVLVAETQELSTAYKGDIVFDFENCNVYCNNTNYLVHVTSGLFKFKNGIVHGNFLHTEGGSVILDNMKVDVPATCEHAVLAENGYIDIVRSNYFTSSASAAVIHVAGGANVIFDGFIETNTASSGIYIIGGGRVTKNGGEILAGMPSTDISAPTGVQVDGGTFVFNGGSITGTGKPTSGNYVGSAICGANNANVNVSVNEGTTGCILSCYNAALWFVDGQGSKPSANVAVVDKELLRDAPGFASDVGQTSATVATVNDVGYTTLKAAVDAAINEYNTNKIVYPVQIENDVEITTPASIATAADVVINGNGHTIYYAGKIFDISNGNVIIENVDLDCKDNAGPAINVTGGTVTINDVSVDNCSASCLTNAGGAIIIDGFDCEESGGGTIGITTGTTGSITVYDMTTKSETPISGTNAKIYQAVCKVPTNVTKLDEFTTNNDIRSCLGSGCSEAVAGGNYYITSREITLQVVEGGGEDGSYMLYDKAISDKQNIILKASDPVESITATASTGEVIPLQFKPVTSDYKEVLLMEPALKSLPAGEYTVSVKLKNSGAIKVPLYVQPKVVQTDNINSSYLYLTKYDNNKKLWLYNAQGHEDGWIIIPEEDMPQHIGLGPDRDSVIWISDACMQKEPGRYLTKLLHDDLDHLGNGTNYVWLDYGSYWVPVKFEVYNAAATISPSTTDWNKIDGDKVFTVWPDVLTVKLNGESLNSDKEYTYKDGKLTLKSAFLKTLANGNYQMEVSTSKGGVFADLTIGEVLRPKNIDYHVYGGNKPITFVGSNKIDYTKGLWIGKQNPVQIPPEYYTVNSDNTFTLSAAYLNRLTTLGTYYISAYVGGQYCTTTFRIISASQAAYNPSTGDNSNIGMWIVILVLAAVVIVVILIPTLKKKPIAEAEAKGGKKDE